MKRPQTEEKRPLRERLRTSPESLAEQDSRERWKNKNPYVAAFGDWMMKSWQPDAFATINVPRENGDQREPHGLDRDPLFYLNLWTRNAEASVLGRRTLKIPDYYRRIVWMFRREVARGMTHYHGIVRFPVDRRWRYEAEDGNYDVSDRCDRLKQALQRASARTPEPFTEPRDADSHSRLDRLKKEMALRPRLVKPERTPEQVAHSTHTAGFRKEHADIDVRPIDVERHAPYLLKGVWRYVPAGVTDEATWDSGLIILPHLPRKGTHKWHQQDQREINLSASV